MGANPKGLAGPRRRKRHPPPPVRLPTCSFPSDAARSLRSIVRFARVAARRGRAVRAFGSGGRRGDVGGDLPLYSTDSLDHGPVHRARRPRHDRAMHCQRERAAAPGGRTSGQGAAEGSTPVVRTDVVPRAWTACPTESHLSHRIPLIPQNPTYPAESHLSRGIPLIPRIPTYPTESHLSHLIPVNPGESRIDVVGTVPPPPVPLPPNGGGGTRSATPARPLRPWGRKGPGRGGGVSGRSACEEGTMRQPRAIPPGRSLL